MVPPFFTSALDEGELHALAVLPPGKSPPGTHQTGGWVGPRAGLDAVEKSKLLPRPSTSQPEAIPTGLCLITSKSVRLKGKLS
jgi:hypothetical protein